jgi:hypothetical protein
VHGVARPRVGEQFAELRALERVEAAGGARVLLEAVDCWSVETRL